jgi:carbamoyl-phosphate synthase large subunit
MTTKHAVTDVPFTGVIAVTGLNATDNPGPGVSVIRSLRADPLFQGRVVGLAYDTLDPGIYARDIVDDVFLIPYPSNGAEALKERLAYIHDLVKLDVIIPTLDSELAAFISLEGWFKEQGIGTFLPTQRSLDLRSKVRLPELGELSGIDVPPSKVISDPKQLYKLHEEMSFPVFVKGLYYGATMARSVDEAVGAFHKVAAQWGLPIIVQQAVKGEEVNVIAVGDGEGGLIGAVPMKKTMITDKGKGWAGVTIADTRLIEMTERFMAATKWRGPCELEVLKGDGEYYLLEVNPRFPAWAFLSAGAGQNLPMAVARLSQGEAVEPMRTYGVGVMFVRIALDQIVQIEDFAKISTVGEILKTPPPGEERAAETSPAAKPKSEPRSSSNSSACVEVTQ